MNRRVGHHPGAVWKKIDLQCHTPRDPGWNDPAGLPGETDEDHQARENWATTFVHAVKSKGLSVFSITDHHDITMIEYVKGIVQHGELIFFPGMEITCSDAVQCLAIFDPSSSRDDLDRLLKKLANVVPTPIHLPKLSKTEQCGLTVEELFSVVSNDTRLKQCVLLIPHFGNEDAHKSLNVKGNAPRAIGLDCDGVYIECPFGELRPGTQQKNLGKNHRMGITPKGHPSNWR